MPRAIQLQATAEETLAAIDAKNAAALLEIGGRIDEIYEQCHKTFWHPNQAIARARASLPFKILL
ncbi:MAG: hypothetical protein ACXV79_09175 [Methylobacter sp.]